MDDKEKRFNDLLEYYARAAHIADNLLDSGLLEKRVEIKDFDLFQTTLTASLAGELREAEKQKTHHITDEDEAQRLAEAYFAELRSRGQEWQHADLYELFLDYSNNAKD